MISDYSSRARDWQLQSGRNTSAASGYVKGKETQPLQNQFFSFLGEVQNHVVLIFHDVT